MLSDKGFTGLIPINKVAVNESHRLNSFTCGQAGLDTFLQTQASTLHQDHIGYTSLLFHEDFPSLVGYITLANDSIPLKTSEIGELGLAYEVDLQTFPAVKIGRLAVHHDLQRQGIGKRILDLTLGELIGAQPVTASRLLITDAVNNDQAIAFYKKYGFEESFWANDQAKNHSIKGGTRTTIKMLRDIYA